MIFVKVAIVWIAIGIIAFWGGVLVAKLFAAAHGKNFDFIWGFKGFVCSVITWPSLMISLASGMKKARQVWKEQSEQ